MTQDRYNKIVELLRAFPIIWDGKDAILEMKNSRYPHWRQLEWMGFYFQFLCEKLLKDIFVFQTPVYGKVRFDGLYEIPFDFKAHAINTSSHQIMLNDYEAVEKGIEDYGTAGVLLALGEVEYNDKDRTFQKWHEELKGGPSKYSVDREKRGAWSRLRKFRFVLKQILIIELNKKTLEKVGAFQKNWRNSDGSPRRSKVMIDLEGIENEIVRVIEF